MDGPRKAGVLLSEAIVSSAAKDVDNARLWLWWAEISQQIADALKSSSGDVVQALVTPLPISILRWALKRTPLHHRCTQMLILTELMQRLMLQESSPKNDHTLKALFRKLISLLQGSEC